MTSITLDGNLHQDRILELPGVIGTLRELYIVRIRNTKGAIGTFRKCILIGLRLCILHQNEAINEQVLSVTIELLPLLS